MFKISNTARAASCRHCKNKLQKGDLRVDKRAAPGPGIYHAECVWLNPMLKAVEQIVDHTKLEGWNSLTESDLDLVKEYISRSKSQNNIPISDTPQPSTSTQPKVIPVIPPPIIIPDDDATSTSSILSQPVNHAAAAPIIISDEDDSDAELTSSKRIRLSKEVEKKNPILPNLLEGVKIPEGPPRTYDECSVCLDPPVHPVTLPCSHIFCFLCAKGLARQSGLQANCSLCRQSIPTGYLDSAEVLSKASLDLDDSLPLQDSDTPRWQWFYEGRNGWWKFEERNNAELEQSFLAKNPSCEMIICGNLYTIDFITMNQYQKNYPTRKRKIKRDASQSHSKGVAGLIKNANLKN